MSTSLFSALPAVGAAALALLLLAAPASQAVATRAAPLADPAAAWTPPRPSGDVPPSSGYAVPLTPPRAAADR